MSTRRSFFGLMAIALATSRQAFAQGELDAQLRDQRAKDLEQARREGRPVTRERPRGFRPVGPQDQRFQDERGGRPERGWHRGDRLPPEWRHRNYVVDDWRGHHLRRPPPGYQWVQDGGDYLLVAIATGVIAEILLNNR